MSSPYRIVVEPQEYQQYAAVIDRRKILRLPFANLGQGSIPARNWVWEHSISEGHRRHWIMDDNLRAFYYFNKNSFFEASDSATIRIMEDFVDRYVNLRIAGPCYEMFVKRDGSASPQPFILNHRVYSCLLIDNSLFHRWRGHYNEDTDLSLRVLKDGDCTLQFCAFLVKKIATMRMKGGNTDELYRQDASFDGRLEMARSLQRQHPDVVKIARKWGRWQHQVDYRPFKGNKLIRKAGVEIPQGVDNYGMVLKSRGS
jgi:hypothetical protein